MSDLKTFLESSGVAHLEDIMLENGMTLDVLIHANDNELSTLTTRVVDKIKLRIGLDKIYQNKQDLIAISTPASSPKYNIIPTASVLNTSSLSKEFLFKELLDDELDLILCEESSQESSQENCEGQSADNLRRLLQSLTTGKCLLEKSKKGGNLNSRDRAFIVKVVVEAELSALDKLNQTIRRDVWQKWANAISECFKGEPKSLYYVPYHVLDGKVIQASGLIHNRLITHRRNLATGKNRKRSISNSSDSSHSSKSNCSEGNKRVRPLPKEYLPSCETLSSLEDKLDRLRGSSSPYEAVLSKWKATFELRAKLLESHSYLEYFNAFPALKLPNGYKLLSSDFERVYPDANKKFEERFPLTKLKLLNLLTERAESSRVDQTTLDLLELATVGEEQANVAALLSIVTLLRQMPTICIPKKKVWKLSRDEVRNGFLARVATASEIETYCTQRQMLCIAKVIPNQPFILAVGATWANVLQYEVVVDVGLRYQLPNVCSAVMHTFNIYWALDCAYPKESASCWMLLQRTIFQISSKYDTEGVPLRELIRQLETK